MKQLEPYDCIIIGAGPGGLQAAIHLARYNRNVLIFDIGAGRTRHALHIENYLGLKSTTGMEIIKTGLAQVQDFDVTTLREKVLQLNKKSVFSVQSERGTYQGRYVIASSGANEVFPKAVNFNRFFGRSIFTCVDCDGYKTTGKKVLVIGNSPSAVRLALGMQQMYTKEVRLLMVRGELPEEYIEILADESIPLSWGSPQEFLGRDRLEGLRLADGEIIPCEAVMLNLGLTLNDAYLQGMTMDREKNSGKIITGPRYETSVPGLFAVGAIRAGSSQAIIAAGQGATVAIDINKRILAL